jgi:hypothetical protein
MKKLTVIERLLALSLLPKEGSYTDLKLVREAKENLSFNEEEHKLLQFRDENGNTLWNQFYEVDGKLEITVGDVPIKLNLIAERKLQDALKKLDEEGKLTEQYMSLYEKFIEGE